MSSFEVFVNVIRGAGEKVGEVIVPVIANSKSQAMTVAERFVNMSTASNEFGEATWVDQIFPPPMGPTAVAA